MRRQARLLPWLPLLAEERGSQEVQAPRAWTRCFLSCLLFGGEPVVASVVFLSLLTSDSSTSRNNLDKFPITAQAHQDQNPLAEYEEK